MTRLQAAILAVGVAAVTGHVLTWTAHRREYLRRAEILRGPMVPCRINRNGHYVPVEVKP